MAPVEFIDAVTQQGTWYLLSCVPGGTKENNTVLSHLISVTSVVFGPNETHPPPHFSLALKPTSQMKWVH